MGKRIVVALGGNALGKRLKEQMASAKRAAAAIADLIEAGHEVVITHGNGPQVGMMELAMEYYKKANTDADDVPLSVCVAMSQGYIGYDLQNALRQELLSRGIDKPVSTIITQVVVQRDDEAFKNPSKPIGGFLSEKKAAELKSRGIAVIEDAGRGYRQAVASPRPTGIVEIETVKALLDAHQVVIAAGGGGIPVLERENNALKGAPAVIDKDFASALLAREIGADVLIILTAVERVMLDFKKPEERPIERMSASEAREYALNGQFAKGSMLPKVLAAAEFAESGEGRTALITLLEKAADGINGKTGTVIVK